MILPCNSFNFVYWSQCLEKWSNGCAGLSLGFSPRCSVRSAPSCWLTSALWGTTWSSTQEKDLTSVSTVGSASVRKVSVWGWDQVGNAAVARCLFWQQIGHASWRLPLNSSATLTHDETDHNVTDKRSTHTHNPSFSYFIIKGVWC